MRCSCAVRLPGCASPSPLPRRALYRGDGGSISGKRTRWYAKIETAGAGMEEADAGRSRRVQERRALPYARLDPAVEEASREPLAV